MFRFLVALVIGSWWLASPVVAATKPNVIIVMTDDQGLGDFSFTGNPVLKTPHFDAFAKQAVRLTDFHVCPMCSPTRGQLLTGLAALRNGATSVTAGRTFLRPGLPTLAQTFAKAGYQTGLFGKWHLGDNYPHRPHDNGFHEAVYHLGWGLLQSAVEFDQPLIDGRYFHNGVAKSFKGHCTDLWFDRAMDWMKTCREKNEPFLCYIPTNAPHAPHIELEEYIKPYRGGSAPAGFFGMIAHLDKRFGDLDRFLDEQKLKDETIVIFLTDNGGTAGVKTFNAGLRAGKTTYYDGGHRVPCWIRWPGGQLEPSEIRQPTQVTDLFPTLCEFCGIEEPKWADADAKYRGTSLLPLFDKRRPWADRKLVVQYGQTPTKFDCCIIWNNWRLVKGEELYQINADREQKTDVSTKHPDVVKAMREYYESWWKGIEPTLNDFVPQTIGAKQQPIVELTSGEWEGIYADNSGFVREAVGGPTGGKWHIHVAEAGVYEFVLRRWPAIAKTALGDKYEPSAKSPTNKANVKTTSFPTIAKAKMEIAGLPVTANVKPTATAATLRVTLPAGRTTMKAWFADADDKDLCGAFFVTAEKK